MTKLWLSGLAVGMVALASAEPITLRFATTDGAESLPIIRGIVKDFERAHPNIKILIQPIVDNYKNKVLAMTAANRAPDCARMGFQEYRSFSSRGALLPIDDFVKSSPEIDIKGYYPNCVRFATAEGQLWMLPRIIAPTGLIFYNKRLFREAGLAYPDGTWTWDFAPRPELGSKCFTNCLNLLTKKQANGKPIQFGAAAAWPQLWFETLLISRGLKMWDSDERPSRLTVTEPETLKLFQFASDTVNKYRWLPSFSDLNTNNTNAHDEFVKGKIAMLQSGAWEVKKLRAEMKDDWDVTTYPSYKSEPYHSPGEGGGIVIFAATKHPREAWEFVKWMSTAPGLVPLAQAGLDQPAIMALARSSAWIPPRNAAPPKNMPEHLLVTDAAAAAVVLHQTPEYFADFVTACQGSAYDVLTGVKPPIVTMRKLQAQSEKNIPYALQRIDSPPYPFVPGLIIGLLIFASGVVWVYWPERTRQMTNQERKENRSAYLFLLPWLGGIGMTFGPMIYSFLLSFAESDIIQTPKWRGLGNYMDALDFGRDDTLLISLRVTFTYALISIPLGIATALGLALLLNQKVRGVPLWRALYYIPSLASGVATSLIWMKVFNPETGLLNALIYGPNGDQNFLGLGTFLSNLAGTPDRAINWLGNPATVLPAFIIMGMWGAGGGTIIFLAGLQGISTTYYEAATLDGASAWRKFRSVTLPLLTPTLFFSVITGVIGALQVFTQAFIITDGGPDRATMFYMLNLYKKAFGELKMGYASALAWILFVIILIITVIQLRGSKRWVFYEGDLK